MQLNNPFCSFPVTIHACALTGLLAGLWEFPSLLLEEENSDVKQKKALCAEVGRTLGTRLSDGLLQYVGEVSFMFLCAHSSSQDITH